MNTNIVRFRLSHAEHQQLRDIAQREGESVSELVREALYRRYHIGSLTASSVVAATIYDGCGTPQK